MWEIGVLGFRVSGLWGFCVWGLLVCRVGRSSEQKRP